MSTRGFRRAAAAICLALGMVAPATALPGSGVHVDPNSPAGKEYAIPFQSARQVGGGGPGNGVVTAGTVAQAAPFGAGIQRVHGHSLGQSAAGAGASALTPGGVGSSSTTTGGQGGAGGAGISPAGLGPVPRFDAASAGDWSGAVLPVGLVVIAGAALGVALRVRWTSRHPTV